MKLHYYPETDSLYVEFQHRPSADTREIAPTYVSTSTSTVALSASTSTCLQNPRPRDARTDGLPMQPTSPARSHVAG